MRSIRLGLGKAWIALIVMAIVAATVSVPTAKAAAGDTVLTPADAARLLPASVFFRGQSATTQLRNSGGVKFADGMFVLATMVDTSGYSSDVQQKYQAYFIAEVPVKIEGHDLAAGIYGVGFVGGGKFVVLDVGAHDLFTVDAHTDAEMKRPMPLKWWRMGLGSGCMRGGIMWGLRGSSANLSALCLAWLCLARRPYTSGDGGT